MTTPIRAHPNDLRTPAARLFRRNALWFGAGAALLVTCLETLVANTDAPFRTLTQLCWVLTLAGGGSLLKRFEGARHATGVAVLAASSSIFLGLMAWQTGGTSSLIFSLLPMMPMGAALILQDELPATIAASLSSFVVGFALLLTSHASPGQFASTLGTIALLGGVGVFGTYGFRRSRLDALDSERARLEVLEQLRLAELARTQSERLAIVGRLAAGVAHEINNPLAYVKANLAYLREECLADGGLPTSELAALLDDTNVGVGRISRIVLDLMSLSRSDANEVEPVGVAAVAAEALKLARVRLGKNVKLGVDLSGDLPQVQVNASRLSQVILNLLVNAGDALAENGRTDPSIHVGARLGPHSLALMVEDNGPGISPAVLGRLFEPFFTTKAAGKGTGLGLAISREYVEAFGGSLRAENCSSGGARFIIELPLSPAMA